MSFLILKSLSMFIKHKKKSWSNKKSFQSCKRRTFSVFPSIDFPTESISCRLELFFLPPRPNPCCYFGRTLNQKYLRQNVFKYIKQNKIYHAGGVFRFMNRNNLHSLLVFNSTMKSRFGIFQERRRRWWIFHFIVSANTESKWRCERFVPRIFVILCEKLKC